MQAYMNDAISKMESPSVEIELQRIKRPMDQFLKGNDEKNHISLTRPDADMKKYDSQIINHTAENLKFR